MKKVLPGTSLFHPEASVKPAKSSKRKMAPTTPRIDYPVPRILQMDTGDSGAAGAVALAKSVEKTRGKKGVQDKNLEQLQAVLESSPPPEQPSSMG